MYLVTSVRQTSILAALVDTDVSRVVLVVAPCTSPHMAPIILGIVRFLRSGGLSGSIAVNALAVISVQKVAMASSSFVLSSFV